MDQKKKFDAYYDHLCAIQLAQKLARPSQRALPAPKGFQDTVQENIKTTISLPDLDFSDKEIYRDQVWQALLNWSIQTMEMDWAFLTDEKGLVIAEVGQSQPELVEEAASQIAHVLVDLQRDSKFERTQSVFLKKGPLWHIGLLLQFEPKERTCVIIGLVGAKEPKLTTISEASALLTNKLANPFSD